MRVLVKFDNSAKPQPIAGPLWAIYRERPDEATLTSQR